MNVWPVIHRELHAEARHAFNYWLRVLGASVLLLIVAIMLLDQQANTAQLGAKLFGDLNTALFIAIWGLVPLLTSDCLSRERRDGTLGLLFLTPLTSRGLVIGKSLIHAFRAATMLLAGLPVLALPFLLGGVTWREGVMAVLLDASSVCLALAAGLVASSRCTQWNRAVLLSEVFSAILLCGFGCLLCIGLVLQVLVPYAPGFTIDALSLSDWLSGAAITCTGVSGEWSEGINSLPTPAISVWLATVVELFLIAILASGGVIVWVARRLERSRQESPLTTRQLRWRRLLLEPHFWKSVFRSKMRRLLERNPIGWLQQYSTGARLTKWGWVLIIVALESFALGDASWLALGPFHRWVLLILALSLAFCAAGSFRRERQCGVLELILVTPLTVGQIVFGRLRGLWGQFVPAILLLSALGAIGGFDLWPGYYDSENSLNSAFAIFASAGFFAIPVVGLYFSLRQRHFLAAWLLTLCVCLVLPCLFLTAAVLLGISIYSPLPSNMGEGERGLGLAFAWAALLEMMFGLIAGWLLCDTLRRRKFAVNS